MPGGAGHQRRRGQRRPGPQGCLIFLGPQWTENVLAGRDGDLGVCHVSCIILCKSFTVGQLRSS